MSNFSSKVSNFKPNLSNDIGVFMRYTVDVEICKRAAASMSNMGAAVFISTQTKLEGVGFIRKIHTVVKLASVAMGVVFMAASFFMLRSYRKDHAYLKERVEDLEHGHLLEAYRQAGYEVD